MAVPMNFCRSTLAGVLIAACTASTSTVSTVAAVVVDPTYFRDANRVRAELRMFATSSDVSEDTLKTEEDLHGGSSNEKSSSKLHHQNGGSSTDLMDPKPLHQNGESSKEPMMDHAEPEQPMNHMAMLHQQHELQLRREAEAAHMMLNTATCEKFASAVEALQCSLAMEVSGFPEGCECQFDKAECPAFTDAGEPFDTFFTAQTADAAHLGVRLCMYWKTTPPEDLAPASEARAAAKKALTLRNAQHILDLAGGYARKDAHAVHSGWLTR
ncbi:unnamed protein product [Amoebophrya sp. A25]|nr:unnamed protein product [Amoebophrya sp. A25]|eukprot:GSA25T00015827001.1